MPLINYDRIPFHEKKSTGERVIENAFYMPKYEEDRSWYYGYSANDFFGMETKKRFHRVISWPVDHESWL